MDEFQSKQFQCALSLDNDRTHLTQPTDRSWRQQLTSMSSDMAAAAAASAAAGSGVGAFGPGVCFATGLPASADVTSAMLRDSLAASRRSLSRSNTCPVV